jgi:hypothetical protein
MTVKFAAVFSRLFSDGFSNFLHNDHKGNIHRTCNNKEKASSSSKSFGNEY